MKLYRLKPAAGSEKIPKRAGRGIGSGLDRDAGKDEEGQNVRSGGGVRPGFEGGQVSLYRRPPKKRSTNIFAKQYVSINVNKLNIFGNGTEATLEILLERRVINKIKDRVRILGNETLGKNLTVKGCKFPKSTAEKIKATGEKAEMT